MLTFLERQVAALTGVPADACAEQLHVDVAAIVTVRKRLGRDPDDGLPRPQRRRQPERSYDPLDYECLMRGNRGVRL